MRARRLLLALAGVVLGVLVFSVGSAFAATGYGLLVSFGAGQNVGPAPVGLAVDDSSSVSAGDVYVTDGEVVNRYTAAEAAAGAIVPTLAPLTGFGYAFGIAVDPSSGDVYVADAYGTVHKFSASGTPVAFSLSGVTVAAPLGIAVDPSNGNVLVGDGATNTVFEFTSVGVFTGNEYVVATASPFGVAVDGAGHVFVAAAGGGTLRFSAPGVVSEAFGSGQSNGVAVDGAGNVFVAQGSQVVEFDSTGKQVGNAFGTGSLGEPALGDVYGIGLGTGASPLVYVADNTNDDADVFDSGETPEVPVTSDPASGDVGSTTATLRGEVNPGSDTRKTSYYFEYRQGGASCEGGTTTTPGETTGAQQAVSSEVTGLAPETQYAFCLVARNPFGQVTGASHMFTTPEAPLGVESESVTNDTASSAVLNASIDAGDIDTNTTYHFEYGTSEAYGHSTTQSLPLSGSLSASAFVQGLQPATTYHYRVVLSNPHGPIGGVVGEDKSFTTQAIGGPLALLDNRQWEMVSPPNKHGSGIVPSPLEGGEIQAADDGSAFTYVANGPVTSESAGNHAPELSQVFSRRTLNGWETQDISTPNDAAAEYAAGQGAEYRLFSPSLSLGLLEPRSATPLTTEALGYERELYLRNDPTGEYSPLVSDADLPPETNLPPLTQLKGFVEFEGASSDLKHVVFGSPQALSPEVKMVTGKNNLYEWIAGKLELVSMLPDGRPASEPYEQHSSERSRLGTNDDGSVRGAISNDGSRIVWESKNGRVVEHHLYLTDMNRHETVQLDAPQGASPEESPDFALQGVSNDGSRIFFTDQQPLLPGSHAGPFKYDLYVAEIATGPHLAITLTDLSDHTLGGEPGGVRGTVMGYTEAAGSKQEANVYFVANGRLTSDATTGDCSEEAGSCNLYIDRYNGKEWNPQLVANLSASTTERNDWYGILAYASSRVSPNGRFLAFMSRQNLTGYNNRDAITSEPDAEVYLYDATRSRLVCTSCNPAGTRPTGVYDPGSGGYPGLLVDRTLGETGPLAGSLPTWTPNADDETNYQSRYLSDDGRLFFDSADALTPQDINGLEDVYEYEPPASAGEPSSDACMAGSRTYSAASDGCVNLISSGISAEESAFLDASESGDDVFFLTQARLVPQDYDKSLDVYDAHVCGDSPGHLAPSGGVSGGPCPTVVAEPPACSTADACRSAPAAQPGIFGSPPSATFSGAGNIGSVSPTGVVVKGKALTRGQKLARALKLCMAKSSKRRRASCVAGARRRYGAKTKVASKRGGRAK